MTTQGLSEQEFTDAKAAILYRLDSSMQSPDKRLAAAVTGEFTGKGYQEAARKRETLEKLTLKEVNRIIKKYLSVPGKVTVLVTPENGNVPENRKPRLRFAASGNARGRE